MRDLASPPSSPLPVSARAQPASTNAAAAARAGGLVTRRATRRRDGQLSVLTWNVQLLPGKLPGQAGTAKHLLIRAASIARQINALASDVDVIALQEAWHAPSREVILETTRRFFPHAHAPDDARCGLVLLSAREFPHARATFAPFKAKSGIEGWWFDKGVTATTLETRGGKRVVVLNAHLQSDFWQPRAETRAKQFPEIVDALADAVRAGGGEDGVDAALLCGDLNVAAGSEEYRAMMKALSGGRERGAADLFERRRGRGRDGDRDRDADAHERERHTFPIARWKHRRWWQRGSGKKSAYVRETPVKRLDYVVDLTRLVRGGGGGGGGGGEDEEEEEERGGGRAEVIDGIADDRGAPLSDHACVIAVVSV
jgi:endonuclease/exonuclease/phosphatase family metal-dependent hydrolase